MQIENNIMRGTGDSSTNCKTNGRSTLSNVQTVGFGIVISIDLSENSCQVVSESFDGSTGTLSKVLSINLPHILLQTSRYSWPPKEKNLQQSIVEVSNLNPPSDIRSD